MLAAPSLFYYLVGLFRLSCIVSVLLLPFTLSWIAFVSREAIWRAFESNGCIGARSRSGTFDFKLAKEEQAPQVTCL